MRELNSKELTGIQGGLVFLGAVAIGLAIGAAAKMGYNKYSAYKERQAAEAAAIRNSEGFI